MRFLRTDICSPCVLIRAGLVATMALLLSGWTCSALFVSCQGVGTQAQLASVSPGSIPNDAQSVLLTVGGSNFTPQSQIMWNGETLQTAFVDSHHLQTVITQQTLDSFGASAGTRVQISVKPQKSVDDFGCPIGGNSVAQVLVVN